MKQTLEKSHFFYFPNANFCYVSMKSLYSVSMATTVGKKENLSAVMFFHNAWLNESKINRVYDLPLITICLILRESVSEVENRFSFTVS